MVKAKAIKKKKGTEDSIAIDRACHTVHMPFRHLLRPRTETAVFFVWGQFSQIS
jgi:hypothetical protein